MLNIRIFFNRQKLIFLNKNADKFTDEKFIRLKYKYIFGFEPDLTNPKRYTEKLNYLKLFDKKELYTQLVDKIEVRKYVSEKIGSEYLIPLLGVYNTPEEINFEKLPKKYVLKCNHNSGNGMFICDGKSVVNEEKIKHDLSRGLKEDYFLYSREWPYKNVNHKILCESFLETKDDSLFDYKLFFFNGKFKVLLVCSDRFSKLANDWYDESFNHLNLTNGPKNRKKKLVLPLESLNKMIKLGEKLVSSLKHARVDFYLVDGKIYFGEITLFESSGFARFKPDKWDFIFGDMLQI